MNLPACTRLKLRFAAALCLLGSVGSPVAAFANDGGIALGGSPGLLKNHPSVRMAREVIRIRVDKGILTADCNFVFTNDGPTCTVRMGFPDEGIGAYDPDAEGAADVTMQTPPHTTFNSFRSWVDGQAVPTQLIRADTDGRYWHAKTVRFAAHSTHRVRDVYTQGVGGGFVATDRDCTSKQIGYILHTGASWHGAIGHTEVLITLNGPDLPRTLKLVPLAQVSPSNAGRELVSHMPDGEVRLHSHMPSGDTVVWKGPCRPILSGHTLRFVRENWRPTQKNDIELTFAYAEYKEHGFLASDKHRPHTAQSGKKQQAKTIYKQ